MTWKTTYRSIYYDGAPEPADPDLAKESTALLIIDVQNTYFTRPDRASLSADEQRRHDAWIPFHERMREIVVPRTRELLRLFRENGYECLFARIACHTKNGRDRSLSQKMPGWNNLLLPRDELPSQLVAELQPQGDEIVVTKTTDRRLYAAVSSPTSACPRRCAASPTRASASSWSRIAAPPHLTSCIARSSKSST